MSTRWTCWDFGRIEDAALPDLPWEAATRIILQAEAASAFEDLIESGGIAGLTAPEDHFLPYARDAVLAKDYVKAMRIRGLMAREADRLFERFDALVAPGRLTVATALDQEFRGGMRGTARDIMGAVGNGAGLPGLIVPNGFGDRGLPTSLPAPGPRLGGEHAPRRGPRVSGAHGLAHAAPGRGRLIALPQRDAA